MPLASGNFLLEPKTRQPFWAKSGGQSPVLKAAIEPSQAPARTVKGKVQSGTPVSRGLRNPIAAHVVNSLAKNGPGRLRKCGTPSVGERRAVQRVGCHHAHSRGALITQAAHKLRGSRRPICAVARYQRLPVNRHPRRGTASADHWSRCRIMFGGWRPHVPLGAASPTQCLWGLPENPEADLPHAVEVAESNLERDLIEWLSRRLDAR
jgi:hypothetical protein